MQVEEANTTTDQKDANQDSELINNDTLILKKRRQLFGKRTAAAIDQQ